MLTRRRHESGVQQQAARAAFEAALPMRDGARGQHQPQFLSALDDARIYRELPIELAAQGQRSARQVAQNPAIDDGLLQRTGFVAGLVLCAHHETLETWGQPALDRDLRSVI